MTAPSLKTQRLLEYSMLKGVGPAALRKIAAINCFEQKEPSELADAVSALKRSLADSNSWGVARSLANEQVVEAEAHQVRIISSADADYPALLSESPDNPFILFVKGQLAQAPDNSVAIIGTREPTKHGLEISNRIARYFVEQKWSVVSGLALGCDAAAHRGAIEAKGHTVAVLAHGLQTIAPAQHKDLASKILDSGGALVSQFPMGRPAIPQQFATRDKTQAGMSQGVVLIQSDLTGGSMIASRAAIKYDRWLAVPYPTEKDIADASPKIQANLVLCEGNTAQQIELLRLKDESSIGNVITLRDKDEYSKCFNEGDGQIGVSDTTFQRELF